LILQLQSPVGHVKGIGEKYIQILNQQGIFTVSDLLLHFPVFYIDFSSGASELIPGEEGLFRIDVKGVRLTRNFKKRVSLVKVDGFFKHQQIRVAFFNQPYLVEFFRAHDRVWLHGKVEIRDQIYQFVNPAFFPDLDEKNVVSVYRKISRMKPGHVRRVIENIFMQFEDDYENLPNHIIKKYGFNTISGSFREIHVPEIFDDNQIETQKKRFAYTEFLLFELELQKIRSFFSRVSRIHEYTFTPSIKRSIELNLPFELTPDQILAFEDIVNDLNSEFTMQRLLQGDVGSGKTIIAFLALLIAIKNGYQCAFLAPTEILVNQHFKKAVEFFTDTRIEMMTGSTPLPEKNRILDGLQNGTIDIIFGTHALFNEKVQFKCLSMIVIDEQHRFGVSQRAALYYKGRSVDLLVTTATPIPRTMLLTLFNDLKVSRIISMPVGRKSIVTKIITPEKRDSFYAWLRKKFARGAKIFIVLPLIEKSDFFHTLRSIDEEAEYYKNIFSPFRVGFISGRSSSQQKERVLKAFVSGKTRVLVTTTVIEVGIDVKDSDVIVIENADRYGLAQLHQLRGRVGRGSIQSYCFLHQSSNISSGGKKRLNTLVSNSNGFEIAEADLEMRGGGLISGLEQSGFLDFKIGDVKRDYSILINAQKDATAILGDSSLQNKYISDFLAEVDRKIKAISFS
jgi:ATP-dependent DNA helicase RecG